MHNHIKICSRTNFQSKVNPQACGVDTCTQKKRKKNLKFEQRYFMTNVNVSPFIMSNNPLGGAPFIKNQVPRALATYSEKSLYTSFVVVVKSRNTRTISMIQI